MFIFDWRHCFVQLFNFFFFKHDPFLLRARRHIRLTQKNEKVCYKALTNMKGLNHSDDKNKKRSLLNSKINVNMQNNRLPFLYNYKAISDFVYSTMHSVQNLNKISKTHVYVKIYHFCLHLYCILCAITLFRYIWQKKGTQKSNISSGMYILSCHLYRYLQLYDS